MNRDALHKLRLDRRLLHRRGWIAESELQREIAALPDVGAKATTLGEASDERESAADSAGAAQASGDSNTSK